MTLVAKMADNFRLKVIHQSANFLAVDKNFDLVMNDNDPDRMSLAKLIRRDLPELYNDKLTVFFSVFPQTKFPIMVSL
jgi:hypothetical protein